MNYLLSILIIAVLASQATIWHSLATIRDAIQQTNAIILAACGSDERPCQVAAHAARSSLVRSWYARASAMDYLVGTAAIIPVGSKRAAKTDSGHEAATRVPENEKVGGNNCPTLLVEYRPSS